MLDYIVQSIPFILVLIFWAIRIEVRLARIETNLKWLIGYLPQCLPNLEDHTD